ncbi:hypothetical protein PFISCL1PPCAC_26138, partial [Pristionchus fissidentatus]
HLRIDADDKFDSEERSISILAVSSLEESRTLGETGTEICSGSLVLMGAAVVVAGRAVVDRVGILISQSLVRSSMLTTLSFPVAVSNL